MFFMPSCEVCSFAMRTLRLTIAYDGTNYVGWQRQINGMAVQQLVEEAFVPLVGAGAAVAGASRTDAGVHALGQVASVDVNIGLDVDAVLRAINIRLPPDIRVTNVVDAPVGFHARFDSRGKSYRYRVSTAPVLLPFNRWCVWNVAQPLPLDRMRRAAAALVGTHDFVAFQARGSTITDTVRTLNRVDVILADDEVWIEVDGNGFLRHMVRTIAGMLVEIALGQRPVESMSEILASGDRQRIGQTAPAAGLTLLSVKY